MEMDSRKQKILEAVVLDYIETAEPVGSRTISKKYNLGVSSATIRNEMADLEEMGLIEQPHTSAGRIPSFKKNLIILLRKCEDAARHSPAAYFFRFSLFFFFRSALSTILAFRILDNLQADPEDIATIITAIGNHDEGSAFPVNPVAALRFSLRIAQLQQNFMRQVCHLIHMGKAVLRIPYGPQRIIAVSIGDNEKGGLALNKKEYHS